LGWGQTDHFYTLNSQMQKIKIFFTKNKNNKFSRMPQNSKTYFQQRIKNKDFDLKWWFTEIFFENKINATILSHPGTIQDNDALQELWATAIRKSQSRKEDNNREIKLYFDQTRKKSEKFFIEKGALLGKFKDNYFKTEEKETNTKITNIIHQELIAITDGINITRELTSKPSNIINPETLEQYIKNNLEKDSWLKIKYFGKKEIEKEKMWLLMAVNQWSQFDPKMITMEYNPTNSKEKPIILVWKWLTYDSGWYYAKPYPGMWDMHGDMAGSAAVIGIMATLQKLWIPKRVIWAIWVTENMIDAKSFKNWDIITARNGKTVYVDHTDAEWRLVLADVLSYMCDTYDPKLVMDFATLTWACRVAIWEMYTWAISPNDKLTQKAIKSGKTTNDQVRPLPYDRYCEKAIKWKTADLTNIWNFSRMLWASTAAAFLWNFVHDKQKRIHFDFAGAALRNELKRSYDLKNSLWTGAMVHNILNFLK
jgi:leucyl aminopeptidase